jgi:hypothetical protein
VGLALRVKGIAAEMAYKVVPLRVEVVVVQVVLAAEQRLAAEPVTA